VAVIRGTASPERFIALTAHYDGLGTRDGEIYRGADDNASGVAVLLAAAKEFATRPLQHSLVLVAFDAEEIGLRGARHFVEHPPIDLQKLDLLLNLDMVSRGDDGVLVAAGTSYHPELKAPVTAAAQRTALRVVFGHDRQMYRAGLVEDWTHSSDHGPFHDAGLRFLYLGVEDHADYHQPTDTPDRIPAAFFGEVGGLVLDLLRVLDSSPRS
jgi:Zn-dependent M28 family amino/carboxypeptidase